MHILGLLLILLALPAQAFAHPGKTNYQGGHRCLKGCAEWDLYYGEYHLHDKAGRPVRVAKKRSVKQPRTAPEGATVDEPQAAAIAAPLSQAGLPPAVASAATQEEEPCLPALPGGLLALLLLWLLARRRAARQEKGA